MASVRCARAVSAARHFVQLSRQPCCCAPVSRDGVAPSLEFLFPAQRRRISASACARPGSGRGSGRAGVAATPAIARTTLHAAAPLPAARQRGGPGRTFFSTTAPRGRTRAIFNPQTDENGNEMVLEITPRAAKRLSEVMAKDANPRLALRIQVESGGCHGFQYLMSLVTLPESLPAPSSPVPPDDAGPIREDDTIFTFSPADHAGRADDLSSPKVILDSPSLELLKGSKVDFSMELIGSQFKIVDNPLATSSCGCGTSFDIKI